MSDANRTDPTDTEHELLHVDDLPERDPGGSDTVKDPADWVTGDEPATGAQRSYLTTLAHEAGREVPDELSKADASQLIDELRQQSDRVADA